MVDYSPPFANNADRREPTSDEQDLGFGCGAADLRLFDWLMWASQSEIGEVISFAGLTPSNNDMTQLRKAIQALIAAATGGADTANYLLVAQARARLPIFPEVLNDVGHFGVITPGTGQVRIPAGINFQHRGIYPVITAQTDFATDPSKTYHLRWSPTDGFTLKDLLSNVYNPASLTEGDPFFDSTYDSMLCARVITNSSNVPTVLNLINRDRLKTTMYDSGAASKYSLGAGNDAVRYNTGFNYNWARTPVVHAAGTVYITGGNYVEGFLNRLAGISISRYGTSVSIEGDWLNTISGNVSGDARILAIA